MTVLLTNPRERTRFIRFAIVGAIGAVVDFGVMNLLVNLFSAPLVLAGTLSFIAAVLSNFIWNRYWTYPDSRSKPVVRQWIEFLVVNALGLLIRIPVLALLEPVILLLILHLPFEIPLFSPDVISDNLTLAVAVVIVMFWNFFVNRYWTYSDVE
jgi:putative flippase GtrA